MAPSLSRACRSFTSFSFARVRFMSLFNDAEIRFGEHRTNGMSPTALDRRSRCSSSSCTVTSPLPDQGAQIKRGRAQEGGPRRWRIIFDLKRSSQVGTEELGAKRPQAMSKRSASNGCGCHFHSPDSSKGERPAHIRQTEERYLVGRPFFNSSVAQKQSNRPITDRPRRDTARRDHWLCR